MNTRVRTDWYTRATIETPRVSLAALGDQPLLLLVLRPDLVLHLYPVSGASKLTPDRPTEGVVSLLVGYLDTDIDGDNVSVTCNVSMMYRHDQSL